MEAHGTPTDLAHSLEMTSAKFDRLWLSETRDNNQNDVFCFPRHFKTLVALNFTVFLMLHI